MSVKSTITIRFAFVYFTLVAVAVVIAAQMVRVVTGMDGKRKMVSVIKERISVEKAIPVSRGNILAHDERLLATTIYKYNKYNKYKLFIDLNAAGLHDSIFNKYVDSMALSLHLIIKEKSAEAYARELKADRQKALRDSKGKTFRHRSLSGRTVTYTEMQKLREAPILRRNPNSGGLIVEHQIFRLLPYEAMARNTVGRVNSDGQGYVGIEYFFDRELAGKPGMVKQHKTLGKKQWIPLQSKPDVEPVEGCDIITTLDVDLQEMAEGEIVKSLLKNPDLEWGTAVIMEVATGEVRAIANKKREGKDRIVEEENYALYYSKDPGSTFKLASFMIMLEKNLKLTDSVDTKDGKTTKYGIPFGDEGSKGGVLTLQQAFEKSSNVGTIELSKRLYDSKDGKRDFAERIEALKLREVVNFDISPGRTGVMPNIKPVDKFSGVTLEMMSIGYELEITPMQTLALYNAVANGGVMVHPKFIKAVRQDGRIVKKFPTQVVHASICSKKTLDNLHQMLVGTVENGTARRARSSAFLIAGKTGTAHIAEPKKYTNQKLSSFAGYFPADKPVYSCIVAFKTVSTPNTAFGGAIAAPVFKEIAEKVYARSVTWQPPITEKATPAEAPYTKSGSYAKLQQALGKLGVALSANHNVSEWVTTEQHGKEVLAHNRGMVKSLTPNVKNMGLQDAIYILENSGLKVRFSGKGVIQGQSPEPGTPYAAGDVVALTLSYN
ncbi:MAG: PASTA domain-containing protein [Prevotellaceae bacterium]|jgi:cell division protein FtsI (penicillin-binding protein 3)|nr:PASTA domain-containing protein [Prevotellaceae bacterium]